MNILFFVGTYLLIVLFYFFYLGLYRKNKDYNTMSEVVFLKKQYNLNKSKVSDRKLTWLCVNTNAFIISITGFIVYLIPVKFIFQMLIGFVLLLLLIFGLYEFIGKVILRKKRVKRK